MKEKRISLRFRIDNEQDMKVWDLLEKAAKKKNASKNAVALELLLSSLEQQDSKDALAERIAELVVAKLGEVDIQREARRESSGRCNEGVSLQAKGDSQADEPVVLGESALDFLDMFG